MKQDCIFCKIIGGELPSHKIYEDERAFVFLDIHPINPGHTLVIPKRHVNELSELSDTEAGHLFSIGKNILKALKKSDVLCEGANLFLSDGAVAGQEVSHSHLHIAPRFKGDGQKVGFVHSIQNSNEVLSKVASEVIKHLDSKILPKEFSQPTLETKRLVLEPFKDSDIEDVFEYASHPEISKFVPWESHKTLEDTKFFFNYIRSSTNYTLGRLFFIFAIRLKESGKVIGAIDFKNANSQSAQIDYAIGPSYWGQGYMSEAAMAIKDWTFLNFPEIVRLQASCMPENIGSSRVMEKVGMQKEGLRRKCFLLKGKPIDLVDFALVRD